MMRDTEQRSLSQVKDALENARHALPESRTLDYLEQAITAGVDHMMAFPAALEAKALIEEAEAVKSAIHRFDDALVELRDTRNPHVLADILDELQQLWSVFAGYALQQRVEKEMREIRTRVPHLASDQRANAVNRALRALDAEPPTCRKGHRMTVREGDNGHFWGCSTYPACRETKRLSFDDLARIEEVENENP